MTQYKHGIWYPIDTAPKNKEQITVFYDGNPYYARWMDESDLEYVDSEDDDGLEPGWYEETAYNSYHDTYFYKLTPTHWMPLPEPPADIERKEDV